MIDILSEVLTQEFGRGYGRESLRNARKFYLTFQDRIPQTLFTEFAIEKSQTVFGKLENPTVGILLCQDKNDSLVELTLPVDANIYAAKYELYLPDKKLLQEKLRQWLEDEGDI